MRLTYIHADPTGRPILVKHKSRIDPFPWTDERLDFEWQMTIALQLFPPTLWSELRAGRFASTMKVLHRPQPPKRGNKSIISVELGAAGECRNCEVFQPGPVRVFDRHLDCVAASHLSLRPILTAALWDLTVSEMSSQLQPSPTASSPSSG